ncbi:MAG: hypothetical protein LUD83_09690 [Clostridiales bacterium]|nr:hypothetical protein [Clostridiales bacterium]
MEQYRFALRTELMYYQQLSITDGINEYEAIAEFAPGKEWTLLVWLDDFHLPAEQTDSVRNALKRWLSGQHILVIFQPGSRVK